MADLWLHQEHFFKCLPVFLKYSEETEVESKWIKERLGQLLLSEIPKNKPISVLSVGCGNGPKDAAILESLIGRNVKYTAIDSSQEQLEKFVQNVMKDQRFAKVDFCALSVSCEEFLKQHARETFDLIFFGHVMYTVENRKTVIHGYSNMLSATGVLVNVVIGEETALLRRHVLLPNEPQMATDVEGILQKLGYSYTKESIHFHMDITLLFPPKENGGASSISEEGELLLDFLATTYKFRERFPVPTVKQFLENIRQKSQVVGNNVLVPTPSDAFLIRY